MLATLIRKLKAAKLAEMRARKEKEERMDNRNDKDRKPTGQQYNLYLLNNILIKSIDNL